MINADGALAYFSSYNPALARQWAAFTEMDRSAGIATARLMLSRLLGRTMDDNESPYLEGDTLRDEFGVYDQAFHVLINSVLPNAENSGPAWTAETNLDTPRRRDDSEYSESALRWLGMPRTLRTPIILAR